MNSKYSEIFNFLKQNRIFNNELQEKFYKRIILTETTTDTKVVALLYEIVHSQSKPNIDKIAGFFKANFENPSHLNSFESFVKRINSKNPNPSYKNLFKGLLNQPGEIKQQLYLQNVSITCTMEYIPKN